MIDFLSTMIWIHTQTMGNWWIFATLTPPPFWMYYPKGA